MDIFLIELITLPPLCYYVLYRMCKGGKRSFFYRNLFWGLLTVGFVVHTHGWLLHFGYFSPVPQSLVLTVFDEAYESGRILCEEVPLHLDKISKIWPEGFGPVANEIPDHVRNEIPDYLLNEISDHVVNELSGRLIKKLPPHALDELPYLTLNELPYPKIDDSLGLLKYEFYYRGDENSKLVCIEQVNYYILKG